ncbi:MAG TPA: OmpA family protein [Labilithrix sp.]
MRNVLVALALLVSACGVPKSEYDAAVDDAKKARAECDAKLAEQAKAKQQEVDALAQKLSDAEARAGNADEQTKAELEELRKAKAAAEARAKLFDEFVGKLRKMIDAGKLDITIRRGQIVLALGTDILFDTGKAEIKPDGKQALSEVAAALRDVPNRRFQVAGHTDNVPIKKPEFPSNWELSTARAIAVVKLLLEKGVKADALSAAGYAEFDPAQPNATDKGKAKNRRIEIVLVPNVEELVKLPEVRKSKDQPAAKPSASAPPPPPPALPKP